MECVGAFARARYCPFIREGVSMNRYYISSGGIFYKLSPSGEIYGGPNNVKPSPDWRAFRLRHVVKTTWILDIRHLMESSDGWEIYKRNEKFNNGFSQWNLEDVDHGTTRRWGERVFLVKTADDRRTINGMIHGPSLVVNDTCPYCGGLVNIAITDYAEDLVCPHCGGELRVNNLPR